MNKQQHTQTIKIISKQQQTQTPPPQKAALAKTRHKQQLTKQH